MSFGEFGMNWNGDCEPGFLIQTHKCSSKMGRNSHKNTSKSCGKPSQKSGSCYSCKEGTNFIVMSMCLECNVIKVLVGVMVKCPNTFVHLVCLYMERFFFNGATYIAVVFGLATSLIHNIFHFHGFCFWLGFSLTIKLHPSLSEWVWVS